MARLQPAALTVAFLVLSAAALAAEPGTTFEWVWGAQGENWGVVAGLAALLSFLFAAVAYMFGKAFRQPHLEVWAKNEIFQAIASVILFALLMGFFVFFANFARDIAVGYGHDCSAAGSAPHIACVRTMLNDSRAVVVGQAESIFNVNMRARLYASLRRFIDVSINVPSLSPDPVSMLGALALPPPMGPTGLRFAPFAGVSMISEALGALFPVIFMWISSFIAQEFFLRMVQETLFPITLALGLILRTFFFTRRVGGLLIAIAAGLFTVYPLMYILLSSQFAALSEPGLLWTDQYNFLDCSCGQADASLVAFNCPVKICAPDILTILLLGYAPNAVSVSPLAMLDSNWLFYVCSLIGRLSVTAFFIPVIIGYVTLGFVKGFSAFLGGDMEIAGLTHIL